MTNPSDQPRQNIDDELIAMLKYLRLGRLLTQWDDTLEKARKGRYSSERLLKYIVEEEYRAKRENARLLRRQRAHIPEMLEMETFPFHKQPKLDRKRVMSLYDSFDYMTKQRGVIWLGPTGCGKTGLATSFLLQSIDRGYRGYFITFPELIQELFQSLADRSDRKVFRRYLSYDCLVIDGSPRDPSEGVPSTVFRYDLVYELTSAIVEERPAVPGFDHGANAQAVADAVLESNARGKWVNVKIDAD